MATTLTAPTSSMAIALHGPTVGSTPAMSATAKSSKKQDHLTAGRRRLDEFKQRKAKANAANVPNTKQPADPQPLEATVSLPSKISVLPQNKTEVNAGTKPDNSTIYSLSTQQLVEVSAPAIEEINGKADDSTAENAIGQLSVSAASNLSAVTSSDTENKEQTGISGRASSTENLNSSLRPSLPTQRLKLQTDRSSFDFPKRDGFTLTGQLEELRKKQLSSLEKKINDDTDYRKLAAVKRSESDALIEERLKDETTSTAKQIEELKETKSDEKKKNEASNDSIGERFPPQIPSLKPDSTKRDEFSALEQHIEDLTQDKFSLQRGLDTARALAESLAQENSNLTQDFNQQGAAMNDLKDELDRFREEIRALQGLIKSLKAEKERAELESTSATERSRALAAEVIDLEEKILKTRSNELKLERSVNSLNTEASSQWKKISSLEKDRSNMKSMIEALQEEKNILQAQIRKVTDMAEISSSSSSNVPKTDACTSTEGLSEDDYEMQSTTSIPPEQMSTIESIECLVRELAEEKEGLLRALREESRAATELRAANAEVMQKLERQTQQLELAVAQNMARGEGGGGGGSGGGGGVVGGDGSALVEYVDEGDEVVERVLQWIMRIFPKKHRRGKHL